MNIMVDRIDHETGNLFFIRTGHTHYSKRCEKELPEIINIYKTLIYYIESSELPDNTLIIRYTNSPAIK